MTTDPDHNEGYTIKADIWSLGISLFEIATYKHPFEDARTYCAKISAITSEEPPRLPNEFSNEFQNFIEMW
jgi:mitogen-activated protein kinase kinase 6